MGIYTVPNYDGEPKLSKRNPPVAEPKKPIPKLGFAPPKKDNDFWDPDAYPDDFN